MATWGDLNGPTNIYQRMTQPVNNPVAGRPPPGATPPPRQPTTLAEFLTQRATGRQSRYGDASGYRSGMVEDRANPHASNVQDYGTSPLADIGMYLKSDPFRAWRTGDGGFDEAQFNSYNTVNGQHLYQKNPETGKWEINPLGRLGELNNKFKGLNFRLTEDPSLGYEDGRPNMRLEWDPYALPQDAFGNYGTSVNPIGFEDGRNGTLLNPDMVYDDPFYGRITDPRNMRQHQGWFDKFNDMLVGSPLLLSLVTMGLGGALGGAGLLAGGLSPSTALSLGTGAAGAMGGDYGRILQSIISAGLPMTGLSGMPLNLARAGSGFFTNMLNNNGRGGG